MGTTREEAFSNLKIRSGNKNYSLDGGSVREIMIEAGVDAADMQNFIPGSSAFNGREFSRFQRSIDTTAKREMRVNRKSCLSPFMCRLNMTKVEFYLTNIQIPILSEWWPYNNWLTNIGFTLLLPLTV